MFHQRRLNKLIANLRHERPEIRRDAVVRLGKLKKRAGPALPNLQAALSDPDGLVRLAAQEAIESITAAVGQPSDTRPMVAGSDAMKSVIRCCICSSPINLEEASSYFRLWDCSGASPWRPPINLEEASSYFRANFEYMCRTCFLQPPVKHTRPFTEAREKTLPADISRIRSEFANGRLCSGREKTLPADISRIFAQYNEKRESLKNRTGWLIIVFWFISLFSDHWFVKLVVAVVGLLASIWWLRRYGRDLPEPGTPPWGGMGFGILLFAYFFVLIIIGGMIMAFR